MFGWESLHIGERPSPIVGQVVGVREEVGRYRDRAGGGEEEEKSRNRNLGQEIGGTQSTGL